MKRSEALAKIQKHFTSQKDKTASIKAEIMLKFFEENLNMAPPAWDEKVIPDGKEEHAYKQTVYKWEAE